MDLGIKRCHSGLTRMVLMTLYFQTKGEAGPQRGAAPGGARRGPCPTQGPPGPPRSRGAPAAPWGSCRPREPRGSCRHPHTQPCPWEEPDTAGDRGTPGQEQCRCRCGGRALRAGQRVSRSSRSVGPRDANVGQAYRARRQRQV